MVVKTTKANNRLATVTHWLKLEIKYIASYTQNLQPLNDGT